MICSAHSKESNFVKKLFFISLILLSSTALADWVQVGESNDGIFYFDPDTVRKDGDLRKVWGIQDLKDRDKDGEKSRRYREEYDCKGARKRYLSATTHSGSMAGGDTLMTVSEPSPWSEIRPESVGDDILKLVCAEPKAAAPAPQ